jgi:hypothetical protein
MHTPRKKKEEKFPQSTAQTALSSYMTGQKRTGPAAKVTKHANVKQKCIKKGCTHLKGLLLAKKSWC